MIPFKIHFAKNPKIPLAPHETGARWDSCTRTPGYMDFDGENLNLEGKNRLSPAADFFLGGILLRWIALRDKKVSIPKSRIEKIVVGRDWVGLNVYHVYHRLGDDRVEIHPLEHLGRDAVDVLKSVVPADRFFGLTEKK